MTDVGLSPSDSAPTPQPSPRVLGTVAVTRQPPSASDPQSSDLDPDLKYINQMCDQYNIPFATNAATAEILIHGLERGDLDWREIINPSLKPVTV